MSKATITIVAVLFVVALVGAFGLKINQSGSEASNRATCRPSAPHLAVDSVEEDVVLFFGNSLVFDADWRVEGVFPVNCAKQGLTAEAAIDLVGALPNIPFDNIVLSFGSVELKRYKDQDLAEVARGFETSLRSLLKAMELRWPNAKIFLYGPPGFSEPKEQSKANDLFNIVQQLSSDFAQLRAVSLVSVLQELEGHLATYDGVHLTKKAYKIWMQDIQERAF